LGNHKPNIFEYSDYRAFLRDSYSYMKTVNRAFSFRYFSKLADLSSPNFLKLVMDGQRNLSASTAARFAKGFRLNRTETEFFCRLVDFNQATTPEARQSFSEALIQAKGFKKVHPLTAAQFNYFARWYLIPIRELVGLPGFVDDPVEIAKSLIPAIRPEEAKTAMDELKQLGLIKQRPDGSWAQTSDLVSTDHEVTSIAVARFHREMIRRGGESIDRFTKREREVSSVTVAVTEGCASQIKELIQEFKEKILELAGQAAPEANQVYQLNFQLFPVARKGARGTR
jgi:uncharacterized protein (TIGR02147 family)